MRVLLTSMLGLFLAGCSHNLLLVERTTGATGKASITTAGNQSGEINIALNGKEYSGTWVYVPEGGSFGFGSATASSGTHVAFASGSFAALPMGGGGSVLARAADGSSIRCSFRYSEMGSTGTGECQDNVGGVYDLQIR